MSTKTFCDFSITVHLEGDGLLGGTHEYDPWIDTHASFGQYKMKAKQFLSITGKKPRPLLRTGKKHASAEGGTAGEDLYDYDKEIISYKTTEPINYVMEHNGMDTRVDESIWTELWCHTRDSGIKEMDKREAANVERHVSEGIFQLELYSVIAEYKAKGSVLGKPFSLHHSIADEKIVGIKMQEYAKRDGVTQASEEVYNKYAERGFKETHKGRLVFEITMNKFSEESYKGSVYHIKGFKANHGYATLGGVNASLNSKKHLSSGGSSEATNIKTRSSVEFPPISYTSKSGMERMVHSLHTNVLTPYCQHFMKLNAQDREPLYKPLNPNVANLQLPMWISKMGRLPVACYWSCHDPTTREYASEELRKADLDLYGYNEKTEVYLTRLLVASLRRHGMSEQVFMNTINTHFSLDNKSSTISPMMQLCEEVVADVGTFAANSAYYTADYRMVRQGTKARMVVLDSWDNTILNDSGRSDDCEGMDNTATTVIRAFATGRHTHGFRWESSLLNTVKLFLDHTVIYDLGATVTSAYVDTNNQNIEMKQKDLPMIGDAMDLRSRCDGHCHAIMGSMTDAIKRLEQGNISQEVMEKVRATTLQCPIFQARDSQRRLLLLEPTGSIEPRILPVYESYEGNETLSRKKYSERMFTKVQLRGGLDDRKARGEKDTSIEDISEMFTGEGLQHYVGKQHPMRRISSFYNEIVHGCSLELWKRVGDPALAQVAFGTRMNDESETLIGAKIASFMRTSEYHPLILPFQSHREEWDREVVPLIESVQHQLPIMAFGRYTDEQYEQTHSKFISPLPTTQQKLREEQTRFESQIFTVANNPNLSVVKLQSREWKFHDSRKAQQCHEFLTSRKGVVAVGYYSEHQLPICDPMMDILVIIDVNTCHEMTI